MFRYSSFACLSLLWIRLSVTVVLSSITHPLFWIRIYPTVILTSISRSSAFVQLTVFCFHLHCISHCSEFVYLPLFGIRLSPTVLNLSIPYYSEFVYITLISRLSPTVLYSSISHCSAFIYPLLFWISLYHIVLLSCIPYCCEFAYITLLFFRLFPDLLLSSSSQCSAFVYLPLLIIRTPSFQSPCSPVLCFFYLYSFLIHFFSYNITPPQFRSSYLLVYTSILSLLHLLQSYSPHGLTISVSLLISSRSN